MTVYELVCRFIEGAYISLSMNNFMTNWLTCFYAAATNLKCKFDITAFVSPSCPSWQAHIVQMSVEEE